MKLQLKRLLWLFLGIAFLPACNSTTSTTAPAALATPIVAGEATTVVPLISSPSVPAPTEVLPTSTVPPPTQTLDPNAKAIRFDHVSFVIPALIAQSAASKVKPAVTANKKQPWLVAPQYIRVTFSSYHAPKGSYVPPQILIYPAQDYAAVNSSAAMSLQKLRTILVNPSMPVTNDSLPWLPNTPGEQSIAAQMKIIPFKNGSGIRSLTQYDIFLDPVVTAPGDPIVNRLLFYHFEGLSSDGKTYIVVTLPLKSAILADDPNPNALVPAGGIPYPGLGTDIAHFDYFKAVTDGLNSQDPDSFSPSLNLLDALIASISIAQ
jgi:hypothetical protein